MKENKFQADLKKELRAIFPGCIVTKLDSSDMGLVRHIQISI